jgi:peroxiredoxin
VILDSVEIKNGRFTATALAAEEGLYRLRFEKKDAGFILINDKPNIGFTADYNSLSMQTASFKSPANILLKNFIAAIDTHRADLAERSAALKQENNLKGADSLPGILQKEYDQKVTDFKQYIIQYIDTVKDPVMALFALGYTRSIEPEELEKSVAGLPKRFPHHQATITLVNQYNLMLAQGRSKPHVGAIAPDISMPDMNGNLFSLSKLRGKYVLVDFWASWCGPCRGENPNVVKAYADFKDKNFTVLGVSLDKEKQSWLNAIKDDNLNWYHISDLKYWSSAAVALYGFDGIPFNVLVNPEGKILAVNLRGEELGSKLSELVK